jgi:hypothetical protein
VKLNLSHDQFLAQRAELYKKGFPRPVLGDGYKKRAKYDEAAIDAWLDSKMDPKLRECRQEIRRTVRSAASNWEQVLEQRLRRAA